MPYIGQGLTEGRRRAYNFVATSNQTVFQANYDVGYIDVFQNGILLTASDYTATNGTTVVLNVGASTSDEITIISHQIFSVSDTVSASQGGTFSNNIDVTGNITTTGSVRGPSSFTIDPATHGDNTGTVIIAGDLTVNGTTTTINSTTLDIDDKNIVLASGSANSSTADGSGFTIDLGSDGTATMTYTHATTSINFNKNLIGSGTLNITSDLTVGNVGYWGGTSYGKLTWSATNSRAIVRGESGKNLSLGANGTQDHIFIKTDGNVGIGTNNPSFPLSVEVDNSTWVSRIYNTGSDANASGLLVRTDATSAHNALALGVYADSGYKMVVRSTGNVGIGTTSPLGKLHIQSGDAGVVTPSSQADDLVVEASTEGGITIMTPDNESARIRFTSPSTESGDLGGADIFYRQNINKMSMGTTVSGGKLAFDSGADVETMVLNGGKVGIGTDDPQFKLHVNKGSGTYAPANGVDENIVGFQTSYSADSPQIVTFSQLDGNWVDGTSGADSAFGWLWGYQNQVRGGLIYDHRGSERMQMFSSYGALAFITADSADADAVPTDSNMNERLTILPGGNVGIGTTNPGRKLDVQGTGNVYGRFMSTNATGAGINVKDSAEDWLIQADGGVGPGLAFYDLGRSSYRMIIDSDGDVGIGTNTPSADLHVERGSNNNTGHFKMGHTRQRRGYVGINSSQTRWYKIMNYASGEIFTGVAQLFHQRGGGYNQTGAYRTYNMSVAGYNNGIYGPTTATGDSGESGQGTLEFGSDEALYLRVNSSVYAGTIYFTFTGTGNGISGGWQFNVNNYSTSLP